ncbi:MAG: T9SS type A sorting domain-containing protein [Crocinitomicaceae bacterium]|nr:T9SS type A sorting domain-containing protein [Crocinitomicaceae bacterium]
MKNEKKDLKKRLAKYGMLAAAITGANEAQANIIYTDENPDFSGAVGSQYFLDLNNDAIDDFRIWHNGSSNLYISPLTASNEVLGSGGATFAYPFALSSGAAISSGAGTFFNNGFSAGYQSLNYGSCSFGNWCSITDKFIGVRFNIGGNIHYGWVRLDVNAAGSIWTVKDYAYEDIIGNSIPAGSMGSPGSASAASGIVGTDIADNNSGLDLQIDFNASADETSINEYRLIVIKSSLVGTFDQVAAEALPLANYTSISPTASPTYSTVLTALSVDSDGDLLIINQPYRIYILNMADGVVATTNSLSPGGTDVTLNIIANAAQSIVGTDISDNANASDIQVDFNAAISELGITEYRVMAVKSGSAGTFSLAAAQAVAPTAYEPVTPTGGPYTHVFSAATTDTDGDAIALSQPYTFFILSVSDLTNVNIDSLSYSAADLTLGATAQLASGIIGTDIADNANGLDLQVDFTEAGSELGILAYRVIAVKESAALAFTLNDGLALPATAFMFINPMPTGNPTYTTVFEATKTDSDGDAIVENQPYTIFVLSFADAVDATMSSMTSSANTVTLLSYIGLDEISLDAISAFSNGEQLVINTPEELLASSIEVSLVSMQGQILKTLKLNDTSTTMETNELVSGVYFVRFTNETGSEKTIKVYL